MAYAKKSMLALVALGVALTACATTGSTRWQPEACYDRVLGEDRSGRVLGHAAQLRRLLGGGRAGCRDQRGSDQSRCESFPKHEAISRFPHLNAV